MLHTDRLYPFGLEEQYRWVSFLLVLVLAVLAVLQSSAVLASFDPFLNT